MAQEIRLIRAPEASGVFVPDEAQRAVIEHGRGHLRVLAGPGTGKTGVIVAAVRERVRRGQPADSILVLTYGRMAAQELRSRLTTGSGPMPVATTFHSLAHRLLQAHDPGLRLMGAPEQEAVLREIVQKSAHLPAALEPARHSRGLAEQVRAYIGRAQATGIPPSPAPGDDPLLVAAASIYAEYLDVIGLAGSMDYPELIRRAAEVVQFDAPPAVRELRTIYVDEYQDTDPAQVQLLQHLAAGGAQVVAVGDPDQSIYGFRGADAAGILRFDEVFAVPQCRTLALRGTRRFGPEIAAVARRVVPANALGGIPAEQVHAHRNPRVLGPADSAFAVRHYESEPAQADHLADLLRRVHAGASQVFPGLRLDWSQMAVLVRSGQRDIPPIQRALLAAGIPVEIARDDLPLALMPAVRPLLDVLRAAADVDGGLTPQRAADLLCSPLAGLDPRALARLGRLLRRRCDPQGVPAGSAQLVADSLQDPALLAGIEEGLAAPVAALAQILDRAAQSVAEARPPSRILEQVWSSTDWPRRLRRDALAGGRRAREANQALDAVMELFDHAEQMDRAFESVRGVPVFLAQLADQIIPAAPDRQKAWNRNAVRLLTAHRAKGSQWPLVVVAGVQEGLWPDLRARTTLFADPREADGQGGAWRQSRLLDERRLFYVACTRASRALLVTAVDSATDDGPTPSPFVALAAGDAPIVAVPGRPRLPLTPAGVVAGLRQVLMDPQSSAALRFAVWERLQGLAAQTDSHGHLMFPWALPQRWWGHREWTRNDVAWFDPDAALPVSASGVDAYLRCPRRWFLEKRAQAGEVSSTRLAFGNILHLCAQAIAGGALAPDEDEVAAVLDDVWHAVGYEPGWQARYEREQAQRATQRLLTWMRDVAGEFVGAEIEFDADVELPSGEVLRVRGAVDRIDQQDGQAVITDFKTGKKITGAQAAEHIQMGLYRWIADLGELGTSGQAVAQLLFVREDPPRGQPEPGARIMRQDDPELADWLLPMLDAAACGLRAELAVARPGPACRTCVVADSCPADPRGAEVRP